MWSVKAFNAGMHDDLKMTVTMCIWYCSKQNVEDERYTIVIDMDHRHSLGGWFPHKSYCIVG